MIARTIPMIISLEKYSIKKSIAILVLCKDDDLIYILLRDMYKLSGGCRT